MQPAASPQNNGPNYLLDIAMDSPGKELKKEGFPPGSVIVDG